MTEIIAEVASNHGGDHDWQHRFIDMAAGAGATWVKFQSYQTRHLDPADPQFAWLQRAELSDADHERLIRRCEAAGIKFLTTVYTADCVPRLASLGLHVVKVGSGESSDRAIRRALREGPWHRVFLSRNRWTDSDLTDLPAHWCPIHTVSRYPTSITDADLGRLLHWREVGYSDHTVGLDAARAALAQPRLPVLEVHVSHHEAPRHNVWDKSFSDLATLVSWRETVATLFSDPPESADPARAYVGRWQYGLHS
jgi:sialic acid synthase SpsE